MLFCCCCYIRDIQHERAYTLGENFDMHLVLVDDLHNKMNKWEQNKIFNDPKKKELCISFGWYREKNVRENYYG